MSVDNAEQYKSRWYQRTVELESRGLYGMTSDEKYKKESDFTLKCVGFGCGFDFQEGDKVLDLACGIGAHADKMRRTIGVDIEACDISDTLLNQGRKLEKMRRVSEGIRGRVNLVYGDMGNILAHVPKGEQYKLVTILGSSFLYLGDRQVHEKALADYYSLLKPGGKIALQFRNKIDVGKPTKDGIMSDRLGVRVSIRKADGPSGKFGKYLKPGEEIWTLEDMNVGDGEYAYRVGEEVKDEDGIAHSVFERVYFDKDGNEEKLGVACTTDYMKADAFPVLKSMMEKAGFENVTIHKTPFDPDGYYEICVVTGEKR